MKISVRQSGGFAGTSLDLGAVDTASLASAETAKIEAWLGQLGFLGSARRVSDAVGADFLTYEITVDNQGRRETAAFADDGSPLASEVHAFLDLLFAR